MIRVAYLRVYLPQERTEAFSPHSANAAVRVLRGSDYFVWDESTSDDALTVVWDGRTYVCPRFPRLRMLEGALAFNSTHPGAGIVPDAMFERMARQLEELRNELPTARSHILTSPWHVPLRWFSAFEPEQKTVYEAGHGKAVRYRTAIGRAVDNVEHAAEVIEQAGFDETIVDQVRSLERWLRDFTRDGMLELDYGSVAGLFSDADLVLDDSCSEVRSSLSALERLDYEEAGTFYAAVASRWAPVQALSYVN